MGPYRNDGGALLGEPALTADHAIVACGDGRIVALGRTDGRIERQWAFPAPFAAAPAVRDGLCYTVDVEGVLRAIRIER
jgi:hypothetical protein